MGVSTNSTLTKEKTPILNKEKNGFKNLPSFPHSTPCFPCTLHFLWTSFKRMSLWPRLPWIQANHLRGPRPQFPLHLPNLWQAWPKNHSDQQKLRVVLRERPYTVPGRCDVVPDTGCHIGNFLGGRNRCNDGSRCASCLSSQDCSSGQNCRSGRCVRRPRRTRTG